MKTTTKPKTLSKPATAAPAREQTRPATTSTPAAPQFQSLPEPLLDIHCSLHDEEKKYHGPLISIHASFDVFRERVSIMAYGDDQRYVRISLDHTQTRCLLSGFKICLADFERLNCCSHRESDLRQFYAVQGPTAVQTEFQLRGEVTVKARPSHHRMFLEVSCSGGGIFILVWINLMPLQAGAIAFDLERALADMERFGGVLI